MKYTTLEQSKKLQTLGFQVKNNKWWSVQIRKDSTGREVEPVLCSQYDSGEFFENIPAYDLQTILEALPEGITLKKVSSNRSPWYEMFMEVNPQTGGIAAIAKKTPLLAATDLLIHLLEEKII